MYCEKDLSGTKSVEASDFVLSKMYFSQHMNRGKCFVQNIYIEAPNKEMIIIYN
ncbi:MAG: hypothetical protein K0S75_345 [Clostridia bacterium]|jgi:hypothetical protein|nr:hypothetical protein [Clostridia bacterium]